MHAMKKLYEKDFSARVKWWKEKVNENKNDLTMIVSELDAARNSNIIDYIQEQYLKVTKDSILSAIKSSKKHMYYQAQKEKIDAQVSHNINLFIKQFDASTIKTIRLFIDDDDEYVLFPSETDIIIGNDNIGRLFLFFDIDTFSFDIDNETVTLNACTDKRIVDARNRLKEYIEEYFDEFKDTFTNNILPNLDKWEVFLDNVEPISSKAYAEWLYNYAPVNATEPMMSQLEVSQTDDPYYATLTANVHIPAMPWFMSPFDYEPFLSVFGFLTGRLYTCVGKHGDINDYAKSKQSGSIEKIKPVSKNEINVYARPWFIVVDKSVEFDKSLIEDTDHHTVLYFVDEFTADAYYSTSFDGIIIPASVAHDFETIHASYMVQITMTGVDLGIELDQYSPYADYKENLDIDTYRYITDQEYADSVQAEMAEKKKKMVKPIWEGKTDL